MFQLRSSPIAPIVIIIASCFASFGRKGRRWLSESFHPWFCRRHKSGESDFSILASSWHPCRLHPMPCSTRQLLRSSRIERADCVGDCWYLGRLVWPRLLWSRLPACPSRRMCSHDSPLTCHSRYQRLDGAVRAVILLSFIAQAFVSYASLLLCVNVDCLVGIVKPFYGSNG